MVAGTVQSLARGLDILRMIAEAEDGVRLHEVADALGLKPPTAHSLVKTLVAKGFLARAAGGPAYVAGPALGELAEGDRRRAHRQAAADAVRRLFERLRAATITYAEPRGGELAVLLRMSPERPGVMEEPAGRAFSLYSSSSALVYLAFCPEEERAEWLRRYPFEDYGAHLWEDYRAFLGRLAQVRAKGHTGPRRRRPEMAAVAAPVFGPGREIAATLGASAPIQDFPTKASQDDLVVAVTDAAARLSRNLGNP